MKRNWELDELIEHFTILPNEMRLIENKTGETRIGFAVLLKFHRIVPFPQSFKELLAMHADTMKKKQAAYLFESSWKKKYTDRGIRKILAKYSEEANLSQNLSPHKLRHFLLTWLKKQGIDDALIQPYSGHESRKSLEVYSKLAITDAQNEYNEVINKFPN